jgi:hypothetical protein
VLLHHPYYVIGFHSCDREVGMKIINGDDILIPSKNKWDWLGGGIYFWEQNPERALSYAIDCSEKKQKFNGDIKTPFVIGAIIELGNCLNLVAPNSADVIREAHDALEIVTKEAGKIMPVNDGSNRKLDCAVIQHVHAVTKLQNRNPYDTIRSPFHEGDKIYPESNFTENLHIEICVINHNMIKGYFLPLPHHRYNPFIK